MPITWPKNPNVKDVVTQVDALNARLETLAADFAALKAQLVKGDELRTRLGALEGFAQTNREALRAIFTVFHPIPDHEAGTQMRVEDARACAEGVHQILMEWIEKVGGRLPLLPEEESRA